MPSTPRHPRIDCGPSLRPANLREWRWLWAVVRSGWNVDAGVFQPLHALIGRQRFPLADQLLALLRRQLLKAFKRGVKLFALRRWQLAKLVLVDTCLLALRWRQQLPAGNALADFFALCRWLHGPHFGALQHDRLPARWQAVPFSLQGSQYVALRRVEAAPWARHHFTRWRWRPRLRMQGRNERAPQQGSEQHGQTQRTGSDHGSVFRRLIVLTTVGGQPAIEVKILVEVRIRLVGVRRQFGIHVGARADHADGLVRRG